MKVFILPLYAAATCLLLSGSYVEAFEHPKFKSSNSKLNPGGRYMVEFVGLNKSHEVFNSLAIDVGQPDVQVNHVFDHELFRGASFQISGLDHEKTLESLLSRPDVQAVYPVMSISRPNVQSQTTKAEPNDIVSALLPHKLTQVDRVQKELNKGKGISVGILDTGVDYMHPALGGGFGKGYKVRYGYDLVGNKYNSDDEEPIIKPGPTPLDDCGVASGANGTSHVDLGHGTHVSGIVAGYDPKADFAGVAPEATLGMWRIFGCNGTVGTDIIVKAMLMAHDARVDIISMSLGDLNSWAGSPDSLVAQRIVNSGTPVVVAAGNAGSKGIFTVGEPSTIQGALSVASFDNNYSVARQFEATGIHSKLVYSTENGTVPPDAQLVPGDKHLGSAADGCDPANIPTNLKGKIALLKRGTCTFDQKSKNVAHAGAIGMIVYNAQGDTFIPATSNHSIPVVGVSRHTGDLLTAALKEHPKVLVKFQTKDSLVKMSTRKTASSFSSIGPTYDLFLKPNIAGVGGSIYSTLPRYLGSWGMMSGTSMATPYVAGSIALFLKEIGAKKHNAVFITEQFQNYGFVAPYVNGHPALSSPLQQGAGLVQVYDAITSKVHVSPGQISFNDTSSHKYKTHILRATNYGDKTVTYDIVNKVTLTLAPYNISQTGYSPTEPANFVEKGSADLRFCKTTIRIAPGKTKTVKVTVLLPKTDPKEHLMYGGYIQLKARHKAKDINVPYFGSAGRMRDLPVFDKTSPPYLTDQNSTQLYYKNETYVYQRKNQDTLPVLSFRLLTGTRQVNAELVDAKSGHVVGEAFPPFTDMSRNYRQPDYLFTQTPWNGTFAASPTKSKVFKTQVNVGTYVFRLKALKLFGDPDNSKDWETQETGPIRVEN
ncbi:hypothetical protein DFQ28_000054 [Apophysomyces sp. BC1034]|nr:hypothetical protein DFQ30_007789 [Apophysomyces sp. BC1015]KAG0182835.1 hypothetical protein DFQ29_001775 [Apophysomyces sp. BC1021]KAG0194955.1 hypothetical protein DFQ28_000054 [Apophysomyces sp. BC1034]